MNPRVTAEELELRAAVALDHYEEGCRAFEPAPEDNPEAVPYYRAAAGLRAAWGEEFCELYNHAFHQCFCAAGQGGYPAAVRQLRYMAENVTLPAEPRPRYSWEAAPTKQPARELFKAEFRRAFPGRRLNSKFANEQWEKVREQAERVVTGEYEQALAAHRDREREIQEQNAAERREWLDRVQGIARFVDAVRELLGPEVRS